MVVRQEKMQRVLFMKTACRQEAAAVWYVGLGGVSRPLVLGTEDEFGWSWRATCLCHNLSAREKQLYTVGE